ncbi:hypothetical protein [Microbacterium sp. NPDC057650]|uniref:tail fiber domain-containing protein n=1 Tax=unclassified Microbacterium TaxID=2609290 RepID=UPI00366AE327
MDILTGDDDRRNGWDEINKTRDYITEYGLPDLVPVANGGTGATTAEGARANLELVKWASSADADGKIPVYHSGGHLAVARPTSNGHAADKAYVDDSFNFVDDKVDAKLNTAGGTVTGSLTVNGSIYVPNSAPATAGYTAAYINSDGRLSRGASSERFKEDIEQIDPASLGDIWPALSRFKMIGGDGSWKYGYIAERLAEVEDQAPFVVYGDEMGEPIIASIDFIALLMAQNAQLHQQLDLLEQRLDTIEAAS